MEFNTAYAAYALFTAYALFITVVFLLYVIVSRCSTYTDLRQRLKDADRRYEQLYAEYMRECASNPNNATRIATQILTGPRFSPWIPGKDQID